MRPARPILLFALLGALAGAAHGAKGPKGPRAFRGRATLHVLDTRFPVTVTFRAPLKQLGRIQSTNQFYGGNVLDRGQEATLAANVQKKKTVLVFETEAHPESAETFPSFPMRIAIEIPSTAKGDALLAHFATQTPDARPMKLDWKLDHTVGRALDDAVHAFYNH